MQPRGKGRVQAKRMKKDGEVVEKPDRFLLRPGMFGQDGIHLKGDGRRFLVKLLKWLLEERPAEELRVDMRREKEQKTFQLVAKFKF